MRTLLLDKAIAPLNRLALWRIQLDASEPISSLLLDGAEALFYLLTGTLALAVDGLPLGILGGRRRVSERLIHAVRIPGGSHGQVIMTLHSYAADVLMVTCASLSLRKSTERKVPYVHYADTVFHDVGTGCYRRTVAEVPTPTGYELHCGETLSDGKEGVWSSWPSHAAPEEVERYAEHEEVFWILTNGYFLMRENGTYCTGQPAQGVREIQNGEAIVTPLGSHELTVSPGDVGYYAWFYISFLKKQYNKYSDQSIKKVYVK